MTLHACAAPWHCCAPSAPPDCSSPGPSSHKAHGAVVVSEPLIQEAAARVEACALATQVQGPQWKQLRGLGPMARSPSSDEAKTLLKTDENR